MSSLPRVNPFKSSSFSFLFSTYNFCIQVLEIFVAIINRVLAPYLKLKGRKEIGNEKYVSFREATNFVCKFLQFMFYGSFLCLTYPNGWNISCKKKFKIYEKLKKEEEKGHISLQILAHIYI